MPRSFRSHFVVSTGQVPPSVACGHPNPLSTSSNPLLTTCLACRRHPLWRQARAAFPPDPPRLVHSCPWSRPCRACGE